MTVDELTNSIKEVQRLSEKLQETLQAAMDNKKSRIDVLTEFADVLSHVDKNVMAILVLFFAENYIKMRVKEKMAEEMAEAVIESLIGARPSEEDAEVQPSHERPAFND